MRLTGRSARRGVLLFVAVGSLLGAAPAAAVTIGQTGDASAALCDQSLDWLQPSVLAGASYAAPGNGTITSWSTNSSGPAGQQTTMKMFRPVSGLTYQVVGHDGPRTLTPPGLNTFATAIKVKTGDVLGFHTVTDNNRCAFPAANEIFLISLTDLADGSPAEFEAEGEDVSMNISANFVYDNSFTIQGTRRNKKKGTETITLNLPNPGELTATGNGVKASSATAHSSKSVGAGTATLVVKATGKKRRKLNQTGKVKVNLTIAFTPTGGTTGTQSLKVKLKKKALRAAP